MKFLHGCTFKIILIFLLFSAASGFTQENGRIRVAAIPNISPISVIDSEGNPAGFFIDIINQIGKEEGLHIQYVVTSWQNAMERTLSGDIDLMPGIIWTEEREKIMDFHEIPVLSSWGQVFVRSGSEINTLFDLEGKTIGIMKDDESARAFKELCRGFNISCDFIEVEHLDTVTELIEKKKADAGVFYNAVKTDSKLVKRTDIVFNPANAFFVSKKGENEEILRLIDEKLKKWKNDRDSFYYKSINRWFGVEPGEKSSFPNWLYFIFGGAGLFILILFLWSWTLRKAVQAQTRELRRSEQEILSSLQEKEVLLKEIHHRVKNNMQIISSLLSLQESAITDDSTLELFQASKNRIQAMALVHEELYKSENFASIEARGYMQNLCSRNISSYGNSGRAINCIIKIDDTIHYPIETMIPLGLIINELLTNTIKHGCIDSSHFGISLELTEEQGNHILRYTDEGKGIPEDFDFEESANLGLNLIQQLTNQIQGNLSIQKGKPTVFTIKF